MPGRTREDAVKTREGDHRAREFTRERRQNVPHVSGIDTRKSVVVPFPSPRFDPAWRWVPHRPLAPRRVCPMDVQCERCKTEYEFDDALVSGRGTTVRCTNCGHQFKVRRSEADTPGSELAADRWVVHTTGGTELTFLTLRELQRAILVQQVGRADVLIRGNAPARALGSIAELEPFFDGRASSRPPPGPASHLPVSPDALKRTHSWGAPAPSGSASVPPYRPKIDTLRPPVTASAAPPPPPLAAAPTLSAAGSLKAAAPPPYTAPVPVSVEPPSVAPRPSAPVAVPPPEASVGPDTARTEVHSSSAFARPPVQSSPEELGPPLPPPTAVRRSLPSYDPTPDPPSAFPSIDEPYSMPRRRRVGGWIVAVVLLGAVGVVGWVVAKPYLAAHADTPSPQLDARAQAFLADGERAIGDGNMDLAQEAFDKASALAERDPRVLLDEARIAAAKADVPWLKLRLLPAQNGEEGRTTKLQLEERLARARKTSDDAVAAAPNDPAAVRAKIDALRLTGDRDTARALVSKVLAQPSQPETAYVLAAIDLSENDPPWGTVIERLRNAAAGEGNAGRARAALVYALARSGDTSAAKVELSKLDAQLRPYPLLPNLHELVDKAAPRTIADAGAPRVVDVSSLPQQPVPGGVGGGGGQSVSEEGQGGGLGQASAAIKKGDWARARQIYEGLAARNPSDSEALSGLGDVARAQGDTAGAVANYKRALGVNPSYLPALLGVADTEWASGNRAAAQRAYKEIADRFPEGTYPDYVKTRGEGTAQAPAPATSAPAASAAEAPAPAKAVASSESQ